MSTRSLAVASAADMEALGARLAAALGTVRTLYLRGPLGSGKTTLVRGMLRGLGHHGAVKSPTFTLVESYALAREVHHFDLYRLKDPEELEFLGWRDYLQGDNLCLVEWPERAGAALPPADADVMIAVSDMGRHVQLISHSVRGDALLEALT